MSKSIGIDLGTTYSCVGVWRNDRVEIIPNDQGDRTTPSIVAFNESERLIGGPAKEQAVYNLENTVFAVKRMVGRHFNDTEFQSDMRHWPFNVVNKNNKPAVKVKYKGQDMIFTPEELSSMILVKMKETASSYLGTSVESAVITVPAYFNDSQRQATKDAGLIAGLRVLRVINEPTAAAIAYGLDKKTIGGENILVFDLGGGTFDVSLLNIDNGTFKVKATSGDMHLGGEDFDSCLVDYLVGESEAKYKRDVSKNPRAIRRLRAYCERAKRTLSFGSRTTIELDSLCDGSTRIPKIQKMVSKMFNGKEPNRTINPEEAVAYGAAVQASILSGDTSEKTDSLILLDVAPLSLGIKTIGGIMSTIIKRNTVIPRKESETFTTTSDYQTIVSIEVYEGERIQIKDNNLLGEFKLCGIPPRLRGQTKVEVTFDVDANGILTIYAVEQSTGSMNKITIEHHGRGCLSKEEIERMVNDAEKYKAEDEAALACSEARNNLEAYAYRLRHLLQDKRVASCISSSYKEKFENGIKKVFRWIETHNEASKADYEPRQKNLEDIASRMMKTFYICSDASSIPGYMIEETD